MKTFSRLSDNARIFFSNKFNILSETDLLEVNDNFDILKQRLLNTKKNTFLPNDKHIIIHYDTDYYLPECPYGLTIFNLIKTFIDVDISLNTIIFITNHKDIIKEFKTLVPESKWDYNLPIIIDDCISCFTHASISAYKSKNIPINAKKINKHAVCMMGVQRIHRNILFNHITDKNLFNKIATSYNAS